MEFKQCWCYKASKLVNIEFTSFNPNLTWTSDGFLLGKSDSKLNKFDILIFSKRNVERAMIPSNVKKLIHIVSICVKIFE